MLTESHQSTFPVMHNMDLFVLWWSSLFSTSGNRFGS